MASFGEDHAILVDLIDQLVAFFEAQCGANRLGNRRLRFAREFARNHRHAICKNIPYCKEHPYRRQAIAGCVPRAIEPGCDEQRSFLDGAHGSHPTTTAVLRCHSDIVILLVRGTHLTTTTRANRDRNVRHAHGIDKHG